MERGRILRRSSYAAIAMVLVACSTGCVKRRYSIRTDVPGTLVYVNGEEIGAAPVSKSFTYYGHREITLVADGYETQRVIQPLPAPWWDNNFTDFFTENLLPITLRDERDFEYRMVPAANAPRDDVLNRANDLRQQAQTPLPPKRQTLLQRLGLAR